MWLVKDGVRIEEVPPSPFLKIFFVQLLAPKSESPGGTEIRQKASEQVLIPTIRFEQRRSGYCA